MSLVGKTKELIEAMAKGMVACGPTLVPLADQGSGVSGVMQGLRDRNFFRGQSKNSLFVTCPGGIELIPKTRWNPPGQQPRPRGTAVWCSHVASGKARSVVGDGIDMGGRDFRISLATQFAVAQVVCKENDHVGLPSSSQVPWAQHKNQDH